MEAPCLTQRRWLHAVMNASLSDTTCPQALQLSGGRVCRLCDILFFNQRRI